MNTTTAIALAALTALTPTVTCLLGIILSRQDVRRLEDKMDQRIQEFEHSIDKRFNRIDERLKVIDEHLMQFYSITGRLEGRIDTIEKRAG